MSSSVSCPCCESVQVVLGLAAVLLSLQYLMSKLDKDASPILRALLKVTFGLNILVCCLVLLLVSSESSRQWLFSKIFQAIGSPKKPDPVRCDLLAEARGRVLEIGPGPGTNFKCFQNSTGIIEWFVYLFYLRPRHHSKTLTCSLNKYIWHRIGVEPNLFFVEDQEHMKREFGISFPTRNIDISQIESEIG